MAQCIATLLEQLRSPTLLSLCSFCLLWFVMSNPAYVFFIFEFDICLIDLLNSIHIYWIYNLWTANDYLRNIWWRDMCVRLGIATTKCRRGVTTYWYPIDIYEPRCTGNDAQVEQTIVNWLDNFQQVNTLTINISIYAIYNL